MVTDFRTSDSTATVTATSWQQDPFAYAAIHEWLGKNGGRRKIIRRTTHRSGNRRWCEILRMAWVGELRASSNFIKFLFLDQNYEANSPRVSP
ncbi:hypothetical protein TNCV_1119401 [Trichonephila clavipes]|uniref:Uncharacterized protein n=1 Tax=Trichonephila clavipes TaxID=2585209 RepID=A0A8X6T5J3_TRICX|nr:hypothetical protein TNCV_1119401 [Trichonephila clavipes]